MSVVVMTGDKEKCVGIALGKKCPAAASPLQTQKCNVHKIYDFFKI
jgi:hypothetical protein